MSANFDCEVAIVGFGPTGTAAAMFLGSQGIDVTVIEREADIYPRARAVTINDWTLRAFQSVGLAETLQSVMDETHSLRWQTYDQNVLKQFVFKPGSLGFAPSYGIYQPLMEERLRANVAKYPSVSVQFGDEVVGVEQDEDGVTVKLRSGGSLRARYLLACDGGSSLVRQQMGIELQGSTVDTRWVVIDARVKRWWPNRHILTFWSDKKRPVVDIALAKGNHRWEFPLEDDESEDDFQTQDQLWNLLEQLGVTRDDVEIHQHAFYRHHVRYAEHWRKDRVMLLGDAAHLMPPWAGSGMQSGIRDSHNLAWKLALVVRGRADPTILDTYETERKPDVRRLTEVSVGLGRIIKQELSDEEMQALAAQEAESGGDEGLQQPPSLSEGWLTGSADPVGRMIPQPTIVSPKGKFGLLDDITGSGFRLFGDNVDPASLLNDVQRTAWDALGATYHAVRSADQHSADDADVVDIDGTLLDWMREHGASVVAVRPDFFVAASDRGGLDVPTA